jgi:hypothetical protein
MPQAHCVLWCMWRYLSFTDSLSVSLPRCVYVCVLVIGVCTYVDVYVCICLCVYLHGYRRVWRQVPLVHICHPWSGGYMRCRCGGGWWCVHGLMVGRCQVFGIAVAVATLNTQCHPVQIHSQGICGLVFVDSGVGLALTTTCLTVSPTASLRLSLLC